MQYIISSAIKDEYSEYFTTKIFAGVNTFAAMANNPEQSRLKAVKLAMLLAIQESEKMMLKNKNTVQP
jgi:hypothetical protein